MLSRGFFAKSLNTSFSNQIRQIVTKVSSVDQFKQKITGSKPVIVKFSASWCGPCRQISPFVHDLSESFQHIDFIEVDIDEIGDLPADCNISAVPTFFAYKNGKKVDEVLGASTDRLKKLANTL